MPVVRYLEWFDPDTHELVDRVTLAVTLGELQEIFGAKPEDPMYDCWMVKPIHVEHLQVRVDRMIDLNRFAYFVSAERD